VNVQRLLTMQAWRNGHGQNNRDGEAHDRQMLQDAWCEMSGAAPSVTATMIVSSRQSARRLAPTHLALILAASRRLQAETTNTERRGD
jgi:hypothetical protein